MGRTDCKGTDAIRTLSKHLSNVCSKRQRIRYPSHYSGGTLAIDVATANGEKNADGGPASDIASKESSCAEEDIDEMEVDLDKPWEKPSIDRAKRAGKVSWCTLGVPGRTVLILRSVETKCRPS